MTLSKIARDRQKLRIWNNLHESLATMTKLVLADFDEENAKSIVPGGALDFAIKTMRKANKIAKYHYEFGDPKLKRWPK